MPEGLLVAMGAKVPRSTRKLSLSLLGRAATPIAEATTRLRREPSILGEERLGKTALLGHTWRDRHGGNEGRQASYIKLVWPGELIASLNDVIFYVANGALPPS